MSNPRWPAVFGGLLGLFLMLAACSAGGDDGDRLPPQVGFVVVQPAEVPISVTLGGRTVAFQSSEVRPQINGLIRRRLFTEGSVVRAGQPLYEIDSALYRAAVGQAEANLASARASAEAAVARAERYRPLAEMEAIAEQDYTDAAAQARVARASVAQTGAALETARINLRYATVTAPIGGRIGRSLFTEGALVSASQSDPLAVIQRLDPIYVDMQQSSAELTALRRAVQQGEVGPGSTSVRLKLEDGGDYPHAGQVQFSDFTVDENTGTVTLRARFPNPQGLLLPGMFVNAVFEQAVQPRAFLVPQPALQRDFDGSAFVYVVTSENKAQRRKVTAARTSGTNWVVTSGLRPGDRVITQGLGSNVRHDAAVRAVPASSAQAVVPPGQRGSGPSGSGPSAPGSSAPGSSGAGSPDTGPRGPGQPS